MKPNTTASFAQFFYRVNPDKTIDAICGYCFTASEPSQNKAGLHGWEATHVCSHWLQQTA